MGSYFVGVWLGQRVSVGRGVQEEMRVLVTLGVSVGVLVMEGVGETVAVGGSPTTRNSPTAFQSIPTKKINW